MAKLCQALEKRSDGIGGGAIVSELFQYLCNCAHQLHTTADRILHDASQPHEAAHEARSAPPRCERWPPGHLTGIPDVCQRVSVSPSAATPDSRKHSCELVGPANWRAALGMRCHLFWAFASCESDRI